MKHRFTKIVATIGPSSRNEYVLKQMIQAGVDVFRLNFSHGTHDDHRKSINLVRQLSSELNKPLALLQDLQGPKIRIGEIENGEAELVEGQNFIIATEPCMGTSEKVSIDYPNLHSETQAGHRILIDDGLIGLEVIRIQGTDIHTRVIEGGTIKPRKGVNLPHIKLQHLASFTEKDKADLRLAFEHDLDFVALSFVRDAKDVKDLMDYMEYEFGKTIPIIAKIEKPEAVKDIDEIIKQSEAIMVARGDLGVETSPEEVPEIQKTIIRKCNLAGRPVITATQMLESMIQNPRPTRAEAGDVANAILDGTSAVMLSGETAAGKYPILAVEMMNKIALQTESSLQFQRLVLGQRLNHEEIQAKRKMSSTEAIGIAAKELSMEVKASYIVCFTHSGGSARLIAKYRPPVPIVGYSPMKAAVRRLCLMWGIIPVLTGEVATIDELLDSAPLALLENGMVTTGDSIVVTAGVPVGKPGYTNMIKIIEIE